MIQFMIVNRYQNSIQIPDYHLSRLSFSFLKNTITTQLISISNQEVSL